MQGGCRPSFAIVYLHDGHVTETGASGPPPKILKEDFVRFFPFIGAKLVSSDFLRIFVLVTVPFLPHFERVREKEGSNE